MRFTNNYLFYYLQQVQRSNNGNASKLPKVSSKNWMKNFDPKCVEDLAVHIKKIQEVEEWLNLVKNSNCSDVLLLTGPVGCGKTATIQTVAAKHDIKVTEWITPLDIDMPTEYGKLWPPLH